MATRSIYVTSDTHFHHANIIKYCNRPFSNTYEMDETMIERWNSVVKTQDKVYHLGDVYLGKYKNESDQLFSRLNGTKVLILGNHDTGKDQVLLKHFSRVYAYRILPEFGLFLSHVPVHQDSIQRRCKFNLHGHTHDKGSPPGPYKSACVELHDYTPQPIESFME